MDPKVVGLGSGGLHQEINDYWSIQIIAPTEGSGRIVPSKVGRIRKDLTVNCTKRRVRFWISPIVPAERSEVGIYKRK